MCPVSIRYGEREVLWLTASEERLQVIVILYRSNLAFDRKITSKRKRKFSSIISSKKILSQVTVSVKNGHRRVQIAQSAIISLNIVIGSLGRESARFVGVQSGERSLQHLWRKQQLIHQRLATWRKKMTPIQSLLMGLRMCCFKKLYYCLVQKCNANATIPLQNMKAKTIPSKE